MKRILCSWFPNWPIQRLVVDRPELRCQQVALFRRDSRRGQLVAAASPLAMQAGVHVDMPLSEAKSLLRRASHATEFPLDRPFHALEHDPVADLEALESLVDELECFSPIVGLALPDEAKKKTKRQPEALFLDITGLGDLFGDEAQLADQLLQHVEQRGYLPRIAIASTPGAAWAFARCAAGQHFRQHQQPLCLSLKDEADLREDLPVVALRLDPATIDTLHQLGIRTLRQLSRLPRNDLAMRFGNRIHRRIDQLTGVLEEPVVARRKPSEFVAEQLLEFPTTHRETIGVVIERLVTELCEQLYRQQQGSLEWRVRLKCQSGPPVSFQVNLFQPTATVQHIMPLIEMQLEQALAPVTRQVKKRARLRRPPQPVSSNQQAGSPSATRTKPDPLSPALHRYTTVEIQEVQVTVSAHVLLVQQQRKLFDENPQLDRQALSHLISRLASRLGTQHVVYPTLQSGSQPEYSFRFKPLVDARRHVRRKVAQAKSQSHVLARPVRLLHSPLRLQTWKVSAEVKEPAALPPSRCLEVLSLHPQQDSSGCSIPNQRVVASSGPERIETGWWRGRTVCRDYWRVATDTGQHYWIYWDHRSRQWWLHGLF